MALTIEERLKYLIIERYGTMINFSREIGMSNSTLASIINRGIHNASVNNIIQICAALNISADGLANNKIIPTDNTTSKKRELHDICEIISFTKMNISTYDHLTMDGDPLTQEDVADILDALDLALDFVKRRRKRKDKNR